MDTMDLSLSFMLDVVWWVLSLKKPQWFIQLISNDHSLVELMRPYKKHDDWGGDIRKNAIKIIMNLIFYSTFHETLGDYTPIQS